MSETDFWAMGPEHLEALAHRAALADRKLFLAAGVIASTLVNLQLPQGKRTVLPEDFVPEAVDRAAGITAARRVGR